MFFEDYKVGEQYNIPGVTITREKIIEFAKEYDPLPLHLDDDYAKSTQFGALIASGLLSYMSVWSRFIAMNIFGAELIAGKNSAISWHAPVYAGDILTGIVAVAEKKKSNGKSGTVKLSCDIFNQDGLLVITSASEIAVMIKPV